MDGKKKQHFKELLKQQKEMEVCAVENIDNMSMNISGNISTGELSSYDNHPADVATEVFQVEHARGLKAVHEDSINKIDEAMNRLDGEGFGICKDCGASIDEERLEILPDTKLCITCAREKDHLINEAREAIRSRPHEDNAGSNVKRVRERFERQDAGTDIFIELIKFGSAESPSEEGNFKDFNDFYNTKMNEDGIVDEMDKYSNEDYKSQLPN